MQRSAFSLKVSGDTTCWGLPMLQRPNSHLSVLRVPEVVKTFWGKGR